ncbi:MAG: hypothetical protein JOZ41_03950, partial [Chloroflexi bacterium]|nr:hypothetical protein [Chloroflexota bacterium]
MDRYRDVMRAIELGSATGIHTWTGLAAVSWAAAAGEMPLDASPLFILSDPDITSVLLL